MVYATWLCSNPQSQLHRPSLGGSHPIRILVEVAGAYLLYLCRNHPCIDGNKRAALGASLVFLRLNGIEPKPDGPEWEELTLAVAAGEIDRDQGNRSTAQAIVLIFLTRSGFRTTLLAGILPIHPSMKTHRRTFLAQLGLGAVGLGFVGATPECLAAPRLFRRGLPRSTPEAQGVSSEGILAFLEAVAQSKHEFHSFMLLAIAK